MTPFARAALISAACGAVLSGCGVVPLMGLPGALALAPVEPLLAAAFGVSPERMFPRDSAWPYAIMVTLALGPLVPLAVLVPWRLSGWRYRVAAAAVFVLGAPMVAAAVYALGVGPLLVGPPT